MPTPQRLRPASLKSARRCGRPPSSGSTTGLNLSNSVVTLIHERRFDEALAACERLRTEFPDVHDWLERSAMVHEARGDFALSLDFYRRHVAFITDPERRDGYDEELIDTFRAKVVELEAKLANTTASSP